MLFLFAIVWCVHSATATYVISVYGDVCKDTDFFSRTYPWLIDNIGGEITVDYYLQGSGRYSVPQMCALGEMRLNTFLQAQYLKCEADGYDSEACLCETGIDPQRYRQCVLTKGSLASMSAAKYSQLGLDARPVIEVGYKNTVFAVEDTWYLKKICTIFGDSPPRGCVAPFACNTTETYADRRSAVQFDCQKNCSTKFQVSLTYDEEQLPIPSTATETPGTYITPGIGLTTQRYYDYNR